MPGTDPTSGDADGTAVERAPDLLEGELDHAVAASDELAADHLTPDEVAAGAEADLVEAQEAGLDDVDLDESDHVDPTDPRVADRERDEAAATSTSDAGVVESEPEIAHGPRTVGRAIADALRAAGVRYAFTVPGESFLGLLDALGDAGIRVITTRHEGAASFMAEAHGQLTGRPAAAIGTRAVGGANLAIGIHTARQDSSPMFTLVGQVERANRGREAFQEIDQVTTLGGLAKWAAEPRTAAEVPALMARAVREALHGRPGPVLLSLPEDLLDEPAVEIAADATRSPVPRATPEEIRSVLELLVSAERPVILAGAGVLRARTSTDLIRFAELLHVPVIASWRRGDVVTNDHPLYLGMAGYSAPAAVRERLQRADAVLVIGSRLNEPTTDSYAWPTAATRWAHVDLEPRREGGLPAPTIAIAADARSFLRAANERLMAGAVLDAARVVARDANNMVDRATWEAQTVVDGGDWDGPGVHPGKIVATLRATLPDDAIITIDAGNFGGWTARGFRFRRPGTFLGPTSGAMGYALPAAITASLVHRDRPVVAIVGDGGLGMTMAELETSIREHARVIVIVFDNEQYGTIRMWQERRGSGQGIATDLGPIDFAAVAQACGARGVRVEHDAEFEPALRAALAADRTTVIHLALDRRWVSVDDRPV